LTTTGKGCAPAPPGAEGLECDKLDRQGVDAHFDGYVAKILENAGPATGKSLRSVFIDSYEVGNQDWSPSFREEFMKRRGYDPVPWLVTRTRRVVDTDELTARFQRDWKQTIADLFADNYYGYMAERVHRYPGLKFGLEPYTGPFDTRGAASDYMALLEEGDLSIDSFHFGGCNTIADTLFLRLPTVTYEGDKWYNRIGSQMLRMVGTPELIATNDDEYVEIVTRLIDDEEFRHEIRDRLVETDLEATIFNTASAGSFRDAFDYLIANHAQLSRETDSSPVRIGRRSRKKSR